MSGATGGLSASAAVELRAKLKWTLADKPPVAPAVLLVLRASFAALIACGDSTLGAADLPRSAPEAQGVSSPEVLAFVEAADQVDTMNSFMLVRHGHVVAEGWWAPYRAEARHSLYSLSKSFTSTAVGLAAAEGKLSVDDEVLKFFPDDAPESPSDNLKSMRVSDLLRMSTGQQTEPPRTAYEPWTKTFLKHPVPFKPGTHFLYNTSATYMQSAIVQQAAGETLLDYLRPRLFEPLGIENPTWETSPQGVSTGGYGLSVRTEDIAKFGQLYLQRGVWEGKQLVPAAWIDAATARQTSNGSNPASDWDQGYGYQFWRCRHGAYRGDGAFGQYCIVLPEQDAVVAITSGVRDMQAILNLVWDKLLPALHSSSLAEDAASAEELRKKLNGLVVRTPAHDGRPAKLASGKYVFPANEQKLEVLTLVRNASDDRDVLIVQIDGADHCIECGRGAWRDGQIGLGRLPRQPAAAASGWSDGVLTAKICFYETPFIMTLQLKFDGDSVTLNSEMNVGFGPTKQPELIGKLAAAGAAADAPGTKQNTEACVSRTFSIVAVDPETGVCGAAVASKYPAVGKVVPYVRGGVGAFCTQHWHHPEWGEQALELLAAKKSPEEVLAELIRDDDQRDQRQLAIIDARGRAAVHNPVAADGDSLWWGSASGRFYACQGNTLAGPGVVREMAQVYETTDGSVADRLMASLLAGDRAGGDHRGRLAAGLRVAKPGVEGLWLELRVDESDDAVAELARQYRALEHEAKGNAR